MKRKFRRQSPIKGGRFPHGAGLDPRIEAAIQFTRQKFGVTVPLIVSEALAFYFGIDLDQRDRVDQAPEHTPLRGQKVPLRLVKRAS